MTEDEIIEYLNHKGTLNNPSPNRFKRPVKDFLIEFSHKHDVNTADFKILFYLYTNNLKEIPNCQLKDCDSSSRFITFSKGFSIGCSHIHAKQISNIKQFGTKTPFESKQLQQKIKKTFIDKYGVASPVNSEKYKQTSLSRYGTDHPMKSTIIKNKLIDRMEEKYGGIGNKSEEIKSKVSITKKLNYLKKIDSVNYPAKRLFSNDVFNGVQGWRKKYNWQCKVCETKFESTITDGMLPRCTTCFPKLTSGVSNMETELFEYIDVKSKTQSDKTILNGKELDIYIPDKKIAIEFNGIYWHSELNDKDKKYHLDKTIGCAQKDIQLLHIFETEWIEKQNIVKSIINSKLGIFEERIYARKCYIKEITTKEKNIFLDENHLQGQDKSSVKIGLFYDEKMVSLMTFGKSRYNKKYQYEMHRFCNTKGYQIIGGASKLWRYFLRNFIPESVITYADRRYSDGTFYEKIGFNKVGESKPNYFYFKGASGLLSRIQFQKHKLKDKLDKFDSTLTEWENMQLNGYDRIWDCGNHVFEWRKS